MLYLGGRRGAVRVSAGERSEGRGRDGVSPRGRVDERDYLHLAGAVARAVYELACRAVDLHVPVARERGLEFYLYEVRAEVRGRRLYRELVVVAARVVRA